MRVSSVCVIPMRAPMSASSGSLSGPWVCLSGLVLGRLFICGLTSGMLNCGCGWKIELVTDCLVLADLSTLSRFTSPWNGCIFDGSFFGFAAVALQILLL